MKNVPEHIGIILDGNRRFAQKIILKPWKGHELGARKVEEFFDWCVDLGLKEVTLYSFSTENFNRDRKEVDFLMKLFKQEFGRIKDDPRLMKNKIRIKFVGLRERFDKDIQKLMAEIEKKTSKNKRIVFNFAMAYGGRTEIVEAVKTIIKNKKQINEKNIEKYLWVNSDVDLIIRTGGDIRTSNFLMWQSAYSELIFLDKLWPEFEKQDLVNCIEEFLRRERRFGK